MDKHLLLVHAHPDDESIGQGATMARYVAEGVPLHELLLVTFTRMATGELRERVRERLASAEAALGAVLDGAAAGPDQVVQVLAEGPREQVQERHRRLVEALAPRTVVVVDDGSGPASARPLAAVRALGATVLTHPRPARRRRARTGPARPRCRSGCGRAPRR